MVDARKWFEEAMSIRQRTDEDTPVVILTKRHTMFNRHAYLVKDDGSFVATLVRQDETNEAFAARVERPGLAVVWDRPPSAVQTRKSAPFPGVNRKRRTR